MRKYEQFRPVSAVNKLGKIKKNIIPTLIMQNTHQVTQVSNNRKERSISPRTFSNRVKSAQPLNIDRESVVQENLLLKTQLNKIQKDLINNKKEINNLESELQQKDKFIEEMMNESNIDMQQNPKFRENHLIINLKKQYKELKKDFEKLQKDNETLKKNIKNTRINELTSENIILTEQVDKLKNLYENSRMQTRSIEQNIQNYSALKEALSKQDYIIISFQQNCQRLSEEINMLTTENDKLEKMKNDKEETNKKLKQKLKLQYQLNEKLVMTTKNIKQTDDYIQMKNKYESKIQKLRKDLAYYRDSNSKNEKLLRDLKQMNSQKENMVSSNNVVNSVSQLNPGKNIIINSNPTPDIQEDPSEQNAKMLLLKSKYIEEKTCREKLEKKVDDLMDQLSKVKKTETKVILQNSFAENEPNLTRTINVTEYDYFSEYAMNEFIYILLKNLEANKIDMSIIESRVLSKETMDLLQNEDNYKNFISTVSNSLCDILKIQQEKDQKDIHSFVKTFLFNYYISKKNKNCQPEEFKNKLLSLFDNIMFYSIEQKQELNKAISLKITPLQDELVKILKYFDENDTGFITFTTLKKVMEELQIKLKNEPLEYFIYIMKNFNESGHYLRDLKYVNLLKVLKDTPVDPNEHPISPEEDEPEKEETEDDAIEITNEEYLNKVKEIIGKICKVLTKNKKPLDDYFEKILSKSIKDYRAIRLVYLVDTLKNDFDIELSHLEVFCLFTKIKPGDSLNKENENDDNIEEIIDYDKLKKEVETYLRNPPIERDKTKDSKTSFNNNFNNGKSGDFPMNKVAYSDLLESNNFQKHTNINNIPNNNKNVIDKEDNLKYLIANYLKSSKISFERFVFPVHCMMKIASNGKKFNRYIDVEIFKHLLVQNSILIYTDDLMKFLSKEKLLFNDGRVNIDYLKFIISGQKGIRDNKMNDFMVYKPYKSNFGVNNDYKEKKNKDKNNSENKKVDTYEESESIKMLQKEIYGDDDGEIEEIKNQ